MSDDSNVCPGDSGGPLTIEGIFLGVISWGYGCNRAGFPVVFSSIPEHFEPYQCGFMPGKLTSDQLRNTCSCVRATTGILATANNGKLNVSIMGDDNVEIDNGSEVEDTLIDKRSKGHVDFTDDELTVMNCCEICSEGKHARQEFSSSSN
uniref:Peptidase S1 domain-containing protein n=1 Tax=Megaselia scalaris TaxID=36166 RepID=T1H550_MEGSC